MNSNCKICNHEFKTLAALSNHITKTHENISKMEYTIEYFYNGNVIQIIC